MHGHLKLTTREAVAHLAGDYPARVRAYERVESEILGMTAEGLSRSEIGTKLNLSEGTVKTYLQRAYEKLGVSGRAAAIAEAMRRGILV